MGAHLLRRYVGQTAAALLTAGTAAACAHSLPGPPRDPPAVSYARRYLAEQPTGLTGNVQHVTNGLWCAGDGAFSMPVVPFPAGPTEIVGTYYDGGVTSMLKMVDANDSVVEVERTAIRPDLPAEEVLPKVASKLEGTRRVIPSLRHAWITQRGVTQIEAVNSSPDYQGREDIMFLGVSQGWTNGSDACRVDRHFVGAGYYFQLIAVALRPKAAAATASAFDPCSVALELAAWAAENIRVGGTCPGK